MNQAVKKRSKGEFGRTDEEFLRAVLASLTAAVSTRGETGVYGEITLKITQKNGRIDSAKIVEEAVMKPGET